VLAVGIERERGFPPMIERVAKAPAQGRALPLVGRLAQDRCAGRIGDRSRFVGRAVVDDQYRQVLTGATNDGRDPRRLVVGRNQGMDLCCLSESQARGVSA
jgi:hypothetical protein